MLLALQFGLFLNPAGRPSMWQFCRELQEPLGSRIPSARHKKLLQGHLPKAISCFGSTGSRGETLFSSSLNAKVEASQGFHEMQPSRAVLEAKAAVPCVQECILYWQCCF